MDAKSKMLEYASQHNHSEFDKLTNEEFCGKMIVEGVVVSRTSNSKVIARARREGKAIIVTETTKTQTSKVVNGKVEFGETETTAKIMRIEL